MAQDVTIAGASYEDVPSIDVPTTGGGTSSFFDVSDTTATAADVAQGKTFYAADGTLTTGTATGGGGDTWSWMGRNPVKLATMPKEHSTFRDLGFDQWTWSTSQSTLRASQNYADSVSAISLVDYDVVLVYKVYIHCDYGDWTPKAAVSETAFVGQCYGGAYYSNVNSFVTGTPNASTFGGGSTSLVAYRYNSSGVKSFNTSGYGIYTNIVEAPSNSGTISAYVVTPKKPVIYARGSTSYFSKTALQNLDFDASYYELECEVWRVDHGTSYKTAPVGGTRDILINGGLEVTS